MGQQEYPSGARDMVAKMLGNQLKMRRSAKPERMIKYWLVGTTLMIPAFAMTGS